MKCREVEEALVVSNTKGADSLMHSVQAHIEECKRCREFARIVEWPAADAHIDSSQIEGLQKTIVAGLRPVRPLPSSWVFLAAFALIFGALTYVGVLHLGAYGWFVLMPVQRIAVFTTLAASTSLLAFSLVRQMVPGQKSLFRPGLLPVGVLVMLCLVVASVFQVRTDLFLRNGKACLEAGVPYAIPAAVVFWLILRRGAILSPRVVGAISGTLAGLVSTTVLEVHCPNLNVWHILVWHVGIALLGLIAGLLVAIVGQMIRWRTS